MTIEFTIPGASKTTAQHKGVMVRNGRVMFFKKKEICAEERRLGLECQRYRPEWKFENGVAAEITFVFPFTKAEEKKHKLRSNDPSFTTPKLTRPDVDNCSKTIIDVLTKCGFWSDDSQICTLLLSKQSGWTPCIKVRLSDVL